MSNSKLARALQALAVALAVGFASPVSAQKMSLDDCMRQAVQNNSLVKAAALNVEAREGERKSVRGRFLPVVSMKGNVIVWDEAQELTIDLGSLNTVMGAFMGVMGDLQKNDVFNAMLSDATKQQLQQLQTMNQSSPSSMLVRDKVTYGVSFTVAQPLTPLYQVYSGYWASDELEASAKEDKVKTRRDLELNVAKAYLGLITASRMVETAKAGLTQAEAYEKQVQAFLDAQMVEKNALMKIQVQKAEIQKNLFLAEKGVKLLIAALNFYMGRPLETPLEPAVEEGTVESADLLTPKLSEQQQQALAGRPDLKSARHQAEAARAGRHAAIGEMIPQLNAFFTYENNQGMGSLSKENQYYGGLSLTWNIWEWGATYYKLKAAEARQAQAATVIRSAEDGVSMDVESKRYDLEEALQVLKVARVALEQAKENLRVEQARYEVQQTTTTDLLQAQTLALKSENDAIAAEMKVKDARYSLQAGMGRDLLSSTKEEAE